VNAERIKPLNPEGNNAHMDTDSRTGNGIECITITDTSEPFHCLVNNWSQEVPLSRSKAQVLVFTYDHSQPYIFDVPESMQDVWDVCEIANAQVREVGKEGVLESRDVPMPAQ